MIEVKILTQEARPSELRALALFLNTLAHDKDNNCGDNTKRVLLTSSEALAVAALVPASAETVALPVCADHASIAAVDARTLAEVEAFKQMLVPTPLHFTPPLINDGSAPNLPTPLAAEIPEPPKPTPVPPAPTPADVFGQAAPPPAAPLSDAAPVALDKAGLPWDSRIHSSSKTINQTDGLWRAKRGVADDVVARVTAELHAVMAIPKPAAASVASIPTSATVTDASSSPAPASPPVPGVPANLGELMTYITRAETAGTLTREEFTAAWQATGVVALPLLASRPDLIAVVYHSLAGKL